MGSMTTTTWTCDRCGVKLVLAEREQPKDWTTWLFRTPPLGETETRVGVLCNECGGLAVEFVHSKDEKAIRQAREIARLMRQTHRLGDVRDGLVILDEEMANDALMLCQRIDAPQYQRVSKRLSEQIKVSKSE